VSEPSADDLATGDSGADMARIAELEELGVRFVYLTLVDNAGITRLKMIPIRRLATVARSGVGMSTLIAIFTIDDHAAYLPGVDGLEGPSGDLRMVPVLGAAAKLSGSAGLAWAPVDQVRQDGQPTPTCQRTFLRRMQAAATATGLGFKMAFEVEFTLLPRERALHEWPAFSAAGLLEVEGFAIDIVSALEDQGIRVDQIQAEAAPGQFEIAVAATEPLEAADRYVLLRLTIRRIAAMHGHDVSFAPALAASEALGNGCHIHFSVWRDGQNLFAGGDAPLGLSREGDSAVAGVLSRLHECCAIFAPSVSSYQRLQPGHWCGAYTTWGVDNREAALRLSRGAWASRASGANFELKPADGAANPYLAAGIIIAAAIDGIQRGARLPAETPGDPATLTPEQLAAVDGSRLPADLSEALAALAVSTFARDAMGDEAHAAFVATRRNEWETFREYDRSELVKFHELRYG
jgi:glutamine synthetase